MSLWLRIALYLAGLGGLVALAMGVIGAVHDMRDGRAARICAKAAKSADKPLDACAPAVKAAIEATRQATACDDGLARGDAYRIRTACSAAVKRVEARATVAESNASTLGGQLTQALADRDAAVARAEARGRAINERIATNERTIAAAPRRADGRVHCDAECLRSLAGASQGRP